MKCNEKYCSKVSTYLANCSTGQDFKRKVELTQPSGSTVWLNLPSGSTVWRVGRWGSVWRVVVRSDSLCRVVVRSDGSEGWGSICRVVVRSDSIDRMTVRSDGHKYVIEGFPISCHPNISVSHWRRKQKRSRKLHILFTTGEVFRWSADWSCNITNENILELQTVSDL